MLASFRKRISSSGDEVTGMVVLWVSLDPRSGEVNAYPRDVAAHIEKAFASGAASASLLGQGPVFQDKVVEFGGGTGDPPCQRTSGKGGKRDVRRLEVSAGSREVSIYVFNDRSWRIAEFPVAGMTVERKVKVGACGIEAVDPEKAKQERLAALAEADASGLVGLWEWCHISEPGDLSQVPPSEWGCYSEEQNSSIEAAFRSGATSASVSIGIRSYDIFFDGPEFGRQIDKHLKKRRFVRRRLLTEEARTAELGKARSQSTTGCEEGCAGGGEDECAVCTDNFAETPMMPVVRLPDCGHTFHGACVQEVADKGGDCPLCRGKADWKAAFSARTRA